MNEPTPETARLEVAALLERRRTAQAKERLKHFLRVYPDNPELLLLSGRTEHMDDNYEAALSIAQQVLAQDPDNVLARDLLFDVLEEEKRLPEAERVIIGLLKDYPEHASFYGKYAMLMISAMLLPKARALAEEGLRYDPDDPGCLIARLLCDFIEQRKEAKNYSLEQMLVRHPDALHTLAFLVLVLQERGEHRAALRVAREILRATPDDEGILDIVLDLKTIVHWTMWPLWPLQRWGWTASAIMWLIGIVTYHILGKYDITVAYNFAMGYLAYLIYSWVWPPIVRRWIVK